MSGSGESVRVAGREMPLNDLLSMVDLGSFATWEEWEASVRARLCLCCGKPGHYQEMMDAHVAAHGLNGLAVYIDADLRLDGNHRVIAARRAGITTIPLESKEEAGERWMRTHGPVGWLGRKVGDIEASEMSWIVYDALSRMTPWSIGRNVSSGGSRATSGDAGAHGSVG